jgi:hypothetical protein
LLDLELAGLYPGDDMSLKPVSSMQVTRPQGALGQPEDQRPPPKVAYQGLGQGQEPVALAIGLVPVNDKDALAGLCVLQHQPFVCYDPVLAYAGLTGMLYVVIAQEHVQPISTVELVQQIIGLPVCAAYGVQASVLPQFVSIPDLDVGKPSPVVVI